MSYQPPPGAPPPPAPVAPQYGPQVRPKKSSEQLISNGLIIAIVLLAGILMLLGAIMIHVTGFLDSTSDADLIRNLMIVALILMDIASFMLIVFLLLAAIMRSDLHHWVRVALVVFAALVLTWVFTSYSGALLIGLATPVIPFP